eukprot:3301034-Rhodomonas_salina.1
MMWYHKVPQIAKDKRKDARFQTHTLSLSLTHTQTNTLVRNLTAGAVPGPAGDAQAAALDQGARSPCASLRLDRRLGGVQAPRPRDLCGALPRIRQSKPETRQSKPETR